ncbi:hypothetical protein [Nocardia tengchongensis]|uniref:hypothetical protein n=1 Tax=Nocardia tengchongensis TaxID=2055889 RepID=UPI003623AD75
MGEPIPAAQALINTVLARYSSLDDFFRRLWSLVDPPTEQLPVVVETPVRIGRHRLRESAA